METTGPQQVTGVAWYKPEQWERLLDISEDADELEETYEEWKAFTEKKIKDLKKRGIIAKKVIVDTEDLLLWCNTYRMPVNGRSRSDYVAKTLREMARKEK